MSEHENALEAAASALLDRKQTLHTAKDLAAAAVNAYLEARTDLGDAIQSLKVKDRK